MDVATLQAQIAAVKLQLTALNTAVAALADPTVKSYSIDTGQGSQTVTRMDLLKTIETIGALENRLCTLQARLDGSGTKTVVPLW